MEPVPLVDYAAFIDMRWHELVLWVCKTLETYTMTELWALNIGKFSRLTEKAEAIQAAKMAGKTT